MWVTQRSKHQSKRRTIIRKQKYRLIADNKRTRVSAVDQIQAAVGADAAQFKVSPRIRCADVEGFLATAQIAKAP